MQKIEIPREILDHCYAHGRETYPEEGCGVLSGPDNGGAELDGWHPIANILNRMHEEEPERYPRTAANGYLIEPGEMMRLEKELASQGRKIKAIFHTHVDVGAYFSEEDSTRALWAGRPVLPGVAYLVCGIKNSQPDGAILAWFDESTESFVTAPVEE